MKIEKEIRFYFPQSELNDLVAKLKDQFNYEYSYHEITTMYDNPNPDLTFYSKEIDGRLRLRYSNIVESKEFGEADPKILPAQSQCLITWKRRLPGGQEGAVRREEEIEYTAPAEDFKAVTAIFEDVLRCKRVSSYERIRNFLSAEGVQVTCDQFPYGIMLEFELKSEAGDESELFDVLGRLGLKPQAASSLSCDDMYFKLCEEQGVAVLPDIAFDDETMPKITG